VDRVCRSLCLLELLGALRAAVFKKLKLLAFEEVLAVLRTAGLVLADDQVAGEVAHLDAGGHLLGLGELAHAQQPQQVVLADGHASVLDRQPLARPQLLDLGDVQLDLVGGLVQHLPLALPHPQQLSDDFLVLPAVEGAGPVVLLQLAFHDLRQRAALAAALLHVAQQVLLLPVGALQPAHHAVLRPVALPCRSQRLRQALQRSRRLLALAKAEVLVVGENDVVDDLLPHILPLLQVLDQVRLVELQAAPQTVQRARLVSPRQQVALLQEKHLGQEVLD
jgi:hypothetical protein